VTALLTLGGMVIHANADGSVQLGEVSLPAWLAQDISVRLAEAAGEVPEVQASRRRVREHLNALGTWQPAKYRNVETRQTAMGMLLRLPGRDTLAWLRVSDTVTCLVRREGELYARGCGLSQWREDTLLGFTFDAVDLTTRLSVRWGVKGRTRARVAQAERQAPPLFDDAAAARGAS
jgi:hypothetical protein